MQSVKLIDTFGEGIYVKPVRTIGIVNGGGDAPGLNAVIRGVVRSAMYDHGMRVSASATALLDSSGPRAQRNSRRNSSAAFCPVVAQFLAPPIVESLRLQIHGERQGSHHDYSSLCMENARRLGVDAMIVTGGDGTQHIARDFFN
jgi:6-phosphofructokinase 1